MEKQEAKQNETLVGEGNEPLSLENSTNIPDPSLAINKTLSNSLLTSIGKAMQRFFLFTTKKTTSVLFACIIMGSDESI
jgi:hypothetical protein